MDSTLLQEIRNHRFDCPHFEEADDSSLAIDVEFSNSLSNPVEFPPISQTVFTGDIVAIVLQDSLPNAELLTQLLIHELVQNKISPSDIYVVVSSATADTLMIPVDQYGPNESEDDAPPPLLDHSFGLYQVRVQVHSNTNSTGLSYLVANQDGEPVFVNRTLVDADVVIPIGFSEAGDSVRQSDCIYPEFGSDHAVQRLAKNSFLKRCDEIELANNTLGCFFGIQVVFRPGNQIHQIITGLRQKVVSISRDVTNELWKLEIDNPAEMLVTTIETRNQNWHDLVDSVIAGSRALKPGTPIVVWSEIDQTPPKKIRQACQFQFGESVSNLDEKLNQFAALVADRPVFLRCNLPRAVVEDLGLGFLQSVDEIVRIARPFENRLLIRDAHKCQIVAPAAQP